MATSYRPRVLPVVPCIRGIVLDTLTRSGAAVYQRSDDPTDGAEVREVWADDGPSTPVPVPLPSGWRPLV